MKILVLASAALMFGAFQASAQAISSGGSIALNWDQCYGDGSIYNKTFACDTNSGVEEIVISATPPTDIPAVLAMQADIFLMSSGASLAPWWNLATGCRSGPPSALSASFNFTTDPPSSCLDPWQGAAAGGSAYTSGFPSPNGARAQMVCAVAAPVAVLAGRELRVAKVVINHSKTVGAGACAGCSDPMCIVLRIVEFDQNPGLGNSFLVQPKAGTNSDLLTWQPGVTPQRTFVDCDPGQNPHSCEKTLQCVSVTPTSRSTWGAIKSMYR